MNTPRWQVLLVVAAAVLPYLNSLDGGFHYDDEHALVRNPHLRQLSAIPQYFVDASTFSSEPAMAMYRPLLQTTFAINYANSGFDTWSWHLTSVLLHAAATVAALLLLRSLVPASVACLGAVLFAVHPVQSQAVNYLSSRSEVLCVGLVLWSLVLWTRQRQTASSGLLAAALLTKSAAVTWWPMALLLCWRSGWRHSWRTFLPPAGVTAAYLAVISLEGFLPRSLGQDVRPYAWQLWTQMKALVYYVQMSVVPNRLSIEHDFSVAQSIFDLPVLAAGAVPLSLLWLTRRCLGERLAVPGLTWLWFVGGLGLTLLVPLNVLVNEHRLYLPLLGIVALVAVGLRRAPTWAGVALVALFAASTIHRNVLWQNELLLWSDATSKAPNSFRSWSNLALAQHEAGQLQAAAVSYERALSLRPGHARTLNNRGLLLEESGHVRQAITAYEASAANDRRFSGPLANLGRLQLALGDQERAFGALQGALLRNPMDLDARLHMARWRQARGQADSARAGLEELLRLDPGFRPAANNLGLLYADAGDWQAAQTWLRQAAGQDSLGDAAVNLFLVEQQAAGIEQAKAYRRALERFPQRPELLKAVADQQAARGDWSEALRLYQQAAEGAFQPGLQAALAQAWMHNGDAAQARAAFARAVEEDGRNVRLWNGWAAAAAADGALEEAMRATETALRIDPDNARAKVNEIRLREARNKAEREQEKRR